MIERRFVLPQNRGEILIESEVLKYLNSFLQTAFFIPESGGQIFSPNPDERLVRICKATGPYIFDKRTRNSFKPNIKKAMKDRQVLFGKGLYSVGLWHTHPESCPFPSDTDKKTTVEYLNAFNGDMDGFLQIILGNKGEPVNIGIWIALNTGAWIKLKEV